jgi:sulfhydrogenase subunit beta (sulfur reductase)
MLTYDTAVVDLEGLGGLVAALGDRGYTVIGPTVRDGAIVFDEVTGLGDLPAGWTDDQDGGSYRLRRRDDDARFGYAVGPHSWKRYLFPPRTMLWRAERSGAGFAVSAADLDVRAFAFLGVRGCDLAAIAEQDKVFLGDHPDPTYAARRAPAFVVAVNCSTPAATCFCVSMGTGPGVGVGHDLALTELLDASGHRFVVEVGSERGADVLSAVPSRRTTPTDREAAAAQLRQAAAGMSREMVTDGIKDLLYGTYEHPRWDDVAARCLTCANCTMVCPTCFCSTVEDTTDLTGDVAERWRSWDSCFTLDFTELGGHGVRSSTRSRYRQWMTHKLATWIDQFGSSGCVGCGRCITWCPVGIDITEEVRALRRSPAEAT